MGTNSQVSSVDFSKGLYKEHEGHTDSLDAIAGKNSLTLSIHDGFFASIFATLTGGVFLTGFALSLGGNEFHIGVLAAIPLVANLFQFVGSYLVQRTGSRTPISINASAASRFIWLLIVTLPFASACLQRDHILWMFLAIIALSHFSGAVSAVAWLSWISDLVPEKFRGRFFGKRNMMIGVATLAFSLLGGKFLDLWGESSSGFQILFFMAVIAGAISILYLKKIPEPPLVWNNKAKPYHEILVHPLKDANFRRLLIFTIIWSFGVNFSAPFFVVYKLKELHLSYTTITLLVSITVF
ncbi:MAG TPA: MFS transporter, partial [Thermodesulfobacteriota bacterium]|nr:MFS transporter [Thermodesulfobacteriota bacterium]